MNKEAQQMTLGTIISIVLGIAVLVFLIFGFSNGWANTYCEFVGCEPKLIIIPETNESACLIDYNLDVLVKCIDLNQTPVSFCYEVTRIEVCEDTEVLP